MRSLLVESVSGEPQILMADCKFEHGFFLTVWGVGVQGSTIIIFESDRKKAYCIFSSVTIHF